jgi:hypothetical protein
LNPAKEREDEGREQEASFFEKKEAKKLLLPGTVALRRARPSAPRSKSFLLLFFKKEALSSFSWAPT